MGSAGFNAAIRIVPQASRQLGLALLGVHCLVIALALVAFEGGAYGVLLGVASLVHWWQWRRELAAFANSGDRVLFDSDGAWWIQRPDGLRIPAKIAGNPLITTWLMVLPLHAEGGGGPRRLVLLSDNLPADDFRRLRVRLSWSTGSRRS